MTQTMTPRERFFASSVAHNAPSKSGMVEKCPPTRQRRPANGDVCGAEQNRQMRKTVGQVVARPQVER